jgi:hypothetical protein
MFTEILKTRERIHKGVGSRFRELYFTEYELKLRMARTFQMFGKRLTRFPMPQWCATVQRESELPPSPSKLCEIGTQRLVPPVSQRLLLINSFLLHRA